MKNWKSILFLRVRRPVPFHQPPNFSPGQRWLWIITTSDPASSRNTVLPIETFRFSTFFYSPLLLLHWNPYFGPGTILEAENATYLSTLICAINTYLTSTLHPALRPLLYQHWEFSLKQVQVARNRISGLLPSLRLWFQKRRKVLLYANVHLIL